MIPGLMPARHRQRPWCGNAYFAHAKADKQAREGRFKEKDFNVGLGSILEGDMRACYDADLTRALSGLKAVKQAFGPPRCRPFGHPPGEGEYL